jgi:translation initiation factor IF-1
MALPLAAAQPAFAQEAYEWEPDEGWHEEEWYDPSDWFDDEPYDDYMNTYDYEDDDWFGGWGDDWGDDWGDEDWGSDDDRGYSYYGTGSDDDRNGSAYDDLNDDDYYYYDANRGSRDGAFRGSTWDGYDRYDNRSSGGNADRDRTSYGSQPYYRTRDRQPAQNRGWQNQTDDNRDWQQQPMRDRRYDQQGLNQGGWQGQSDTDRGWQQGSMQDRRSSGMGQQAVLSGRLDRVERAGRSVDGHALYRVRMDNGQTRVLAMDAGDESRLRMNRGDRVQIRGTPDMLGNQRVLKVDEVRTQPGEPRLQGQRGWQGPYQADAQRGGQYWSTQARSGQDRSGWQTDRRGLGSGELTIDARLSSVERSVRDADGHALFRVRTDDGRTRILAIEPDKASELRDARNERVRIEGERATVGGRQVIKVTDIQKRSGSD